MLDKKSLVAFVLFLVLIILFDTMQQKYYVDTFNLAKEPIPVSVLLWGHVIRWIIWVAFGLPFGFLTWRILLNENLRSINKATLIAVGLLPILLLAIITISMVDIVGKGLSLDTHNFKNYFIFYFYQKGITFLLAYSGLSLWLFSNRQAREIEAQWIALEELKKSSSNNTSNQEPQITVKLGNRIKALSLQEIVWIQADDYCVRIHTKDQSFYLRKSLKFLEAELAAFRFIRIHRGALLNLNFLDQLNLENYTLKLHNEVELPVSKSGAQLLRRKMKEESI